MTSPWYHCNILYGGTGLDGGCYSKTRAVRSPESRRLYGGQYPEKSALLGFSSLASLSCHSYLIDGPRVRGKPITQKLEQLDSYGTAVLVVNGSIPSLSSKLANGHSGGKQAARHVCFEAAEGETKAAVVVSPFALLGGACGQRKVLVELASKECGLRTAQIADLYPATDYQEHVMMGLLVNHTAVFTSQFASHLDPTTDIVRFRESWSRVARDNAILRTILVASNGPSGGLYQVVADDIIWQLYDNITLDAFLDTDRALPIGLGDRLTRYAIVCDPVTKRTSFIWTAHHAAFDSQSIASLVQDVQRVYEPEGVSLLLPSRPDFNLFVDWSNKQHRTEACERFWVTELLNALPPTFPAGPQSGPQFMPYMVISKRVRHSLPLPHGVSLDTLIKATWSLVLSQHENSPDVVFGTLVGGRVGSPGWDLGAVIGPTKATVPFRVRLADMSTVEALLAQIQNRTTAMTLFEHTGLANIRAVSDDARFACSFRNLVIIRSRPGELITPFALTRVGSSPGPDLNLYPLTLEFTPDEEHTLSVHAAYQSSCISTAMINILLEQFDHVLQQIEGATHQCNDPPMQHDPSGHPISPKCSQHPFPS